MAEKRPSIWKIIVFPLFIVVVIALAIVFRHELIDFFRSPKAVRALIRNTGWVAPFVFIFIQFVQVVIFVIPGEVAQVAGGYIFGPVLGVVYSVIGIAAGSLVNFILGRAFGVPFVEFLFGREKVARYDALAGSPRAQAGFFLLFVVPGIPKDILCYVAGISELRPWTFLGVSMAGRLPGIIGSCVIGSSAELGRWKTTVTIIVVAAILFLLGVIFQDRIHDFAERLGSRRGGKKDDGKDGTDGNAPET